MNELSPSTSALRAFCTFRADRRLYGIDVSSLREISTNTAITPVPPAPRIVRGLTNLRSRILLVLDLRPLLGLAPVDCTSDSRLVILKPAVAEDAALLVDRGGDIISVSTDRIEAGPDDQTSLDPVAGVCKLDEELMMIIDATRLAGIVARQLQ